MRSITRNALCLAVLVAVSLLAAPRAWAGHCDGIDPWARDLAGNIVRDFQGNQVRNPARVACDATPHPPSAQDIVNQLFAAVRGAAVQGANQLNQWRTEAQNAVTRTASDFAGCPSNAAQQLYNDLKARRAQAEQVRNAARQQDQAAQQARQTCLNQTGNSPLCHAAYNELPFAAQAAAAQGVMDAEDTALAALRALRCVAGCGQYAKVRVPTVTVGAPEKVKVTGAQVDVCTHVSGGHFYAKLQGQASASGGAAASASPSLAGGGAMRVGGSITASVDLDTPRCDKTQAVTIPSPGYCEWRVDVLLPQLKSLKVVPPEATPADVKIHVPTKPVTYVSGIRKGSCEQPAKVCTAVAVGATVGLNDNPQSMAQCTQTATVGCVKPALGLEPETSTVNVPDPANASVSWSGGKLKPGKVAVDLTKGELKVACAPKDVYVYKPGPVSVGHQDINTQLCLAPQLGNLVATP